MNFKKHLVLLIILSFSKVQGAAVPGPSAFNPQWSHPVALHPALLPLSTHPQTLEFAGAFEEVHKVFTNNLAPDFQTAFYLKSMLIENLNTFFFISRPGAELPLTIAESSNFLSLLKVSYHSIKLFINQVNPIVSKYLLKDLQESLDLIADRYGLRKIEHSVITGSGFFGNVYPHIPQYPNPATPNLFRDTIRNLSGRIFVVKNTAGGASIVGRSSGIIIPVKDRFVRGSLSYDEIITCCHSISSTDLDPDLEFYFVRSESLDPETGLPRAVDIVGTPGVVNPVAATDVQDFITYLRHASISPPDNNVRRIEKFRPINQDLSDLRHHSPKHSGSSSDCGYGILNREFTFPAAVFASIRLMDQREVEHVTLHAVGPFDYYALGYPVFSYHNLGINNTPMHANLKLSPLTLTTGNSATLEAGQRVLRIQPNNLLHHGAPTMKGMSGGPMFMCEGGTINIMGLVQSGDSIIDENNVCIL